MKIFLLSILVCISELSTVQKAVHPNMRLKYLKGLLESRLSELNGGKEIILPFLVYDANLVSNAKFERDTIWIGQIQREFHTMGDSLSIIYHEYIHAKQQAQKLFPIVLDAKGKVPQWDTGTFYSYEPIAEEIQLQLDHFAKKVLPTWPSYASMTDSIKQLHTQQLQKDLSKSQRMAFIYAPSNLALAEIDAYTKQLEGEKLGLFRLSPTAKTSIKIRLLQLNGTALRRTMYEKQNKIQANGRRRGR